MTVAVNPTFRNRQAELGQFFTPEPIADFMASLFQPFPRGVRLLDAGAGAGALTQALVNRICQNQAHVRSIDVETYEFDPFIQSRLLDTMHQCASKCASAGVDFNFKIHAQDFIREICPLISGVLFGEAPPMFDAAIVNPPYRKINSDSAERRLLRSVGIETGNLYTGFVALIQRLLVPGGQLVAITPRSFCNGPYFQAFRESLLRDLQLRRLHIFESREAIFREDAVLQENIIFYAAKGLDKPRNVEISSSSGNHGDPIVTAVHPFDEIVHPDDSDKFIHIPSNHSHRAAKEALKGLDSALSTLGVSVSTGRIVDFRSKAFLRPIPGEGTVPLIYPCHFNGGTINWPKIPSKKPNAIVANDKTKSMLIPNGIYVLTKRFSSKEERRRVVACLLGASDFAADWIGLENHLNYFHEQGHGLERNLAFGLYAFLNSTVLDQYFRRFSGHTQVNATDLRKLFYPNKQALRALGRKINTPTLSQIEIDDLVCEYICAD